MRWRGTESNWPLPAPARLPPGCWRLHWPRPGRSVLKIDAVTGDELREVMRRFPAPVAIVTTKADDERYGFTAGSVVSLSLEPPLVGVSVGRDSSSHEPMRRARGFTISLLSEHQMDVAQHFARSGIPPVVLWEV